jgi:hypothetical protein
MFNARKFRLKFAEQVQLARHGVRLVLAIGESADSVCQSTRVIATGRRWLSKRGALSHCWFLRRTSAAFDPEAAL